MLQKARFVNMTVWVSFASRRLPDFISHQVPPFAAAERNERHHHNIDYIPPHT